jgi:hypothetical protein
LPKVKSSERNHLLHSVLCTLGLRKRRWAGVRLNFDTGVWEDVYA